MEPMTLGSPSGSPATTTSPYLPSFLLGEAQPPATPNSLSPNKAGTGRNLSFVTSPIANSPTDYNRSLLGQKTLFGYQQTPVAGGGNYPGTPLQQQNHNASISGPPTQGLFDSLRNEQLQTPKRSQPPQPQYGTPVTGGHMHNASGFNTMNQMNQSYQMPAQAPYLQQFNESIMSNTSMNNNSRLPVSPMGPVCPGNQTNINSMLQCTPTPQTNPNFWITVYGFPSSATNTILQHFSQCGTIVDKVFPPQNGNWVHLKYTSRLECDRALNFNEKILLNNIMIGVTHCKDKNILDKENICDGATQTPKLRPMAQTAYKNAQNDSAVVVGQNAPQRSSGLMNKAMDLFFGW